jgi:hypothetical protein
MFFTEIKREMIKDAILDKCEGITWKEFSIDDLDKIIDDIETAVYSK